MGCQGRYYSVCNQGSGGTGQWLTDCCFDQPWNDPRVNHDHLVLNRISNTSEGITHAQIVYRKNVRQYISTTENPNCWKQRILIDCRKQCIFIGWWSQRLRIITLWYGCTVPSYKYRIWRAQSILDHMGPVCVPENWKISESFDMYGISDPVLCPLVICLESSITLYNLGGWKRICISHVKNGIALVSRMRRK